MGSFHDFKVKDAKQQELNLAQFKGQVCLVVNVASQCGLTPQYQGLEELHQKYSSKGLKILGFPCNQFGAQEPGSDAEIQTFCSTRYQVHFPVLAKVEVNGPGAHPVYKFLKSSEAGGKDDIKWNFAKFLIGKNGEVLKRFEPKTEPRELIADIEKALKT